MPACFVAALLGCVDLNELHPEIKEVPAVSQPSWAAWIEMQTSRQRRNKKVVAALLGCVD